MKKRKKYWTGYCDGKILIHENLFGANVIVLYTNRKNAKRAFQDVRPIEVREAK